MFKKSFSVVALLVIFVFLLVGCGGIQKAKDWDGEKKAAFFLSIWNSQFASHQLATSDPEVVKALTVDQRKILNAKKDILVQSKPLLDLYTAYVDKGESPPYDLEAKLSAFITQLEGLLLEVVVK